jgi:hypothetical protein
MAGDWLSAPPLLTLLWRDGRREGTKYARSSLSKWQRERRKSLKLTVQVCHS